MAGLGAAVDQQPEKELADFASTLVIAETARLGTPASHKVRITPKQFLGRPSSRALAWLVTVSAEGLPVSVIEKRLATLTIGAGEARRMFPLEFTLTNQPLAVPQLRRHHTRARLDGLARRARRGAYLPAADREPIEPITGLRLAQVSLKRADDAARIGFGEVALAEEPAGRAAPAVALLPNETKTVFLRLDSSERLLSYGSFTGQVQLVSDGAPPKSVPVTARVTSGSVKALGAVLVLFGLSTSLFLTSRLQPRLARLQALRPATLLRDRLIAFADESTALGGGAAAGIVAEARRQAARLETTALDAQGLLPIAIGSAGTAGAVAQLQALLNDVSERLGALIVLRDAVARLVNQQPAPDPSLVRQAVSDLNAKAEQTVDRDRGTRSRRMDHGRSAERPGGARELLDEIPPRITTQQLDFMLQETASIAALIWAAVSLAIGVTYVYSDVDFGTPMDLLGTFLWGLGLTTFGAGVQQLTPRQVATQVGLTVPRSASADPLRG